MCKVGRQEDSGFFYAKHNISHTAFRLRLRRHRSSTDCSLLYYQETVLELQCGCFTAEPGCCCLEPTDFVLTAGHLETVADLPAADTRRADQRGALYQACFTRPQARTRNI